MDTESTRLEATAKQSPLTKLLTSDSSGYSESLQAYFTQKMLSLGTETGEMDSLEEEIRLHRENETEIIAVTTHRELHAVTPDVPPDSDFESVIDTDVESTIPAGSTPTEAMAAGMIQASIDVSDSSSNVTPVKDPIDHKSQSLRVSSRVVLRERFKSFEPLVCLLAIRQLHSLNIKIEVY